MNSTLRFIVIGLLLCVVCGCDTKTASSKDQRSKSSYERPATKDFFPMGVGTRWKYEIRIGDTKPLCYNQTIWPQGNSPDSKCMVVSGRGLILSLDDITTTNSSSEKKVYTLEFRLKTPSTVPDLLSSKEVVEIEVIKDDLNIFSMNRGFQSTNAAFWALDSGQGVIQALVKEGRENPGFQSMYSFGGPDGISLQMMFFPGQEGISVSINEGVETLKLSSIDLSNGKVEFERKVEPSKNEGSISSKQDLSYLENGFVEYMVFEKGRGMTSLIQNVGGKTSMNWKLIEFSAP